MGLMLAAPAGNDIMYDDKLVEQGRNFCNKIWNSFRLIEGWQVDDAAAQPAVAEMASRWFASQLSATVAEVNDLFDKFRISEALMSVYRLFRDDFSSWYLEMVKPAYGSPIDRKSFEQARCYLDALLRLLHPFMPFITEELWQHLADRAEGESIMYAPQPEATVADTAVIESVERAKEIINGIRSVRARKNISSREGLVLNVIGTVDVCTRDMIVKLGGLEELNENAAKDAAASSFMVGTTEFNIPRVACSRGCSCLRAQKACRRRGQACHSRVFPRSPVVIVRLHRHSPHRSLSLINGVSETRAIVTMACRECL